MAKSPVGSGHTPIKQLQTVANLFETPSMARVYAYVLENGPATVSTVVESTGVPQGTVYDYVERLQTAELIDRLGDQRPYEYDAEPISLTLTTDGSSRTITPALIAAVARREEDEDIDVYVDRHGMDGLALALEHAFEYVDGDVNHRITARELDLSPLEAEIILQALEPIAETYAETG